MSERLHMTIWRYSPWMDTEEKGKGLKYLLWMVIVTVLVSIIPVVNLILTIAVIIVYCTQYSGTSG